MGQFLGPETDIMGERYFIKIKHHKDKTKRHVENLKLKAEMQSLKVKGRNVKVKKEYFIQFFLYIFAIWTLK